MTWRDATIGDLVALQRGHDLPESQRKPGTVPVVGSAGPNGFHNEIKSKGPGVTLGRSGASIGHVTFVDEDYWPHNTCIYVTNFKGNNPRYVAYYLETFDLAQLNSGAAQPSLNRNFVYGVKAQIPDPALQDRIADILSAYDDLIENNRRRIALLEQAARELYKEWFVRFRFPGHEHVKIVDGVPEGWERGTFGSCFEFLGGYPFKSSTYYEGGEFGVVTIKNVHDAKFIPDCPSRLNDVPLNVKRHCYLKTGDILLSLTGNVGRSCIIYGKGYLLNQRVAKVVGKSGVPEPFVYWTFSNLETQKKLENLAYGVAQLNLSPINLAEAEFMRPEQSLLIEFADCTLSMFNQIISLNLANVELARARDLLLPRLMNGSIAV